MFKSKWQMVSNWRDNLGGTNMLVSMSRPYLPDHPQKKWSVEFGTIFVGGGHCDATAHCHPFLPWQNRVPSVPSAPGRSVWDPDSENKERDHHQHLSPRANGSRVSWWFQPWLKTSGFHACPRWMTNYPDSFKSRGVGPSNHQPNGGVRTLLRCWMPSHCLLRPSCSKSVCSRECSLWILRKYRFRVKEKSKARLASHHWTDQPALRLPRTSETGSGAWLLIIGQATGRWGI